MGTATVQSYSTYRLFHFGRTFIYRKSFHFSANHNYFFRYYLTHKNGTLEQNKLKVRASKAFQLFQNCSKPRSVSKTDPQKQPVFALHNDK